MKSIIKKIIAWLSKCVFIRPVLASFLSIVVSAIHKRKITIYYDGVWLRKDGKQIVSLGNHLSLKWHLIRNWKVEATETVDVVAQWWFLHYQPSPGDIILDIGAGMGEDSLLFSRVVGDSGKVYAIEAHPATFECLKSVCQANSISNVKCENLAAYSENTQITIDDGDQDAWHENSVMLGGAENGKKIDAIRMDDYESMQAHDMIHFLKMNIEGAEVDALLGMPHILSKTKNACIACHDFLADSSGAQMVTKEKCRKILLEAGFTVYDVDGKVEPWQKDHIHAVRNL